MTIPQAHPATIPPAPSALQTLLTTPTTSTRPSDPLPLQIAHNLKYQHSWTALRLHHPTHPSQRTLLSGLPPKTLYLHPDEQLALLQRQHESKSSTTSDPAVEREWILSARLDERWTLREMAGVFDSIRDRVPSSGEGEAVFEEEEERGGEDGGGDEGLGEKVGSEWRDQLPKRLLMAMVDEDSTLVYYIVHDGVVKPRQN